MENTTVEDPKPQEEGSNRKAIGLIILIILLLVACGVLRRR